MKSLTIIVNFTLLEWSSLGVGSCVLLGCGDEFCVARLILLCNSSFERGLKVRAFHKCDEALNDKLGVESWDPDVLNSGGADLTSILLHIRVIYLSLKKNLRSLKGVRVAEVNIDDEFSAFVRGILRPNDCHVPVDHAVLYESYGDSLNDLGNIEIIKLLKKLISY